MRPTRLHIENVATFPSSELELTEGVIALTAANGGGKSTLLKCIEVSLFGDGSRDLASMLGRFGDRLEVTLEFEHGGESYRVRRGYRGGSRGQATMDLERWVEE